MTDDELRKLAEARVSTWNAIASRWDIEPAPPDDVVFARAVLRLLEERAKWPGPACDNFDDVIAERLGVAPVQYIGRCCHGITSQGDTRPHAIEMTLEACAIAHGDP